MWFRGLTLKPIQYLKFLTKRAAHMGPKTAQGMRLLGHRRYATRGMARNHTLRKRKWVPAGESLSIVLKVGLLLVLGVAPFTLYVMFLPGSSVEVPSESDPPSRLGAGVHLAFPFITPSPPPTEPVVTVPLEIPESLPLPPRRQPSPTPSPTPTQAPAVAALPPPPASPATVPPPASPAASPPAPPTAVVPSFNLSCEPRTVSVVQGSKGLIECRLDAVTEFDGDVRLNLAHQTAFVPNELTPVSVRLGGRGTSAAAKLTLDTATLAPGTYELSIAATSADNSANTRVLLTVTAPPPSPTPPPPTLPAPEEADSENR